MRWAHERLTIGSFAARCFSLQGIWKVRGDPSCESIMSECLFCAASRLTNLCSPPALLSLRAVKAKLAFAKPASLIVPRTGTHSRTAIALPFQPCLSLCVLCISVFCGVMQWAAAQPRSAVQEIRRRQRQQQGAGAGAALRSARSVLLQQRHQSMPFRRRLLLLVRNCHSAFIRTK